MEGRVVQRARRGNLLTRTAILVVAATAVAVLVPANVAAADGALDPVQCEANPSAPQCVVDITSVTGSNANRPDGQAGCRDIVAEPAPCFIPKWGWNGGDGCYYQPAAAEWVDAFGRPTPPASWYEGTCADVANNTVVLTRMRVFGSPPGQARIVAEALRRLQLPAPAIRLNPPTVQVVHVPTWLWVDASSWATRSATAAVPGLSVTATATPVSVRWSTGDGATITCRGAGTPWTDRTDPAAPSPDCGHTYTTPSGPSPYTLTATITWTVTWTGAGTSGTEPALTSTANIDLRVAGVPALITHDEKERP